MNYDLLAEIREALASGDEGLLCERLSAVLPADLADAIKRLGEEDRGAILRVLADDAAGALLQEMGKRDAAAMVRLLPPERARRILGDMAADEAADLLRDLPDEAADALLAGMNAEDAEEVRELLEYPENTAGGRMATDFMPVSPAKRVSEVIEDLRAHPPAPEMAYYLYVCDEAGRLAGVVSLRDLIAAAPDTRIAEIMTRDVIRVAVDADQREAAELVARYDLLALPVVDAQERMLGVITADAVLEVLEETATEEILHVSSGAEEQRDRPLSPLQVRLRRATAAVAAGLAGAAILAAYRQTFQVSLDYLLFIPLVLVVSEVVTGQVMASIRGAIRHDPSLARLGKAIGRELLSTALVVAAAGALIAWLLGDWQQLQPTGTVLGAAVFLVGIAAGIVGGGLPILSFLLRHDPSAVSGSVTAAVANTLSLATYLWVVVAIG
ncbi:MAG: magnesium transporter [Armatimonadetes bacterium]|nr:magnesium transporter [Armatimonadota bacterium]